MKKKKKVIHRSKANSKDKYYLDIAKAVSRKSPCIPIRAGFGAIVVVNDAIVSTGYTGPARGVVHCAKNGGCIRAIKRTQHGKGYGDCISVHAEENCICNAARIGAGVSGGTMYIYGEDKNGNLIGGKPCERCRRILINANIEYVIEEQAENNEIVIHSVKDWIAEDSRNYNENIKKALKNK